MWFFRWFGRECGLEYLSVANCDCRMGQPYPLDIGMLRQLTQK
jgi:hypothetical protein